MSAVGMRAFCLNIFLECILFEYNKEEETSMNKTELVAAIAENAEISKKDAEKP